jgi:tetratricopeptide (TPR) repeat protein
MNCISKLNDPQTPERLKVIAQEYAQLGLNNKEGGIYKTLAKLFLYSNHLDSAGFYIDKSLQHLSNDFPGASLIPASTHFKGMVYFHKKDYKNAQLYFNNALQLYDQFGQKGHKYHALKFLHRIDMINGDYKAAYNHISKENKNYNETRNREKQRMAKVAETTLHIGLMKEELVKIKYSKHINTLVFSCIVLFVIMTSVFMYFRHRIKQRKLKEKQRIMTSLLSGLGEKRHLLNRLELAENISNVTPTQSIKTTDNFDQCFTETILHFQQKFDKLSSLEVRYAVMIGMGMPNTIIAEINNVQAPSIRKVKQRIRSKICMNTDCNLEQYFSQYIA